MRRDREAASSNYYLRMAQALMPGASDARVQQLRSALPQAFLTDVVPMWLALDDWLDERGGARGISTIRDHPFYSRIGYPLSQALIRASDKAALTRFFAALDVTRRGVPKQDALMDYLRFWSARRPQGLSETLRSALLDDALASLVAPIVTGLAAVWDGQVVTAEGQRRLDLRVVLDLQSWSAHWAVPIAEGLDSDVLVGNVGGADYAMAIVAPDYGSYYRLDGAPPVVGTAILTGARLRGVSASADLPPTSLLILREDVHADGWVSRDAVEPHAEHVLAVHSGLSEQVRSVLEAAADSGWKIVPQRGDNPLVSGYAIFRKVVFSDEGRLNSALSLLPAASKLTLRPDVAARPRLARGLPLLRGVAAGCYLAGGEPDLLLPSGEDPRPATVSLDGVEQSPPFMASGFPIPLCKIPGISLGTHQLMADGERLPFTIVAGSPEDGQPPGTGSVAWSSDGSLGPVSEDGYAVCGGLVPADGCDEPLLVRRGQEESWFLHQDGTGTSITEPAVPGLLLALGADVAPVYFEVGLPRTAVWLAQRRGVRWKVLRVRARGPEFHRLSAEALAIWARLVAHGPEGDPLWRLYKTAWERCRDR